MKLKLCTEPNCTNMVIDAHSNFCPVHKAKHDANKKQSAFKSATRYADYNNPEWRKLRTRILKEHHYCTKCGTQSGLQVHHVIPVRIRSDLFLSEDNLVVLCTSCHAIETQREIQSRKR